MQQLSPIADRGQAPLTPKSKMTANPAPSSFIGSKSSQSTQFKAPKDAMWVGSRLRSYNCFQNEEGALQKYPSFEELVQKTITRKRMSFVNPDSAKKFQQVNRYYERANEDTFLFNILPLIIKPGRTVKSRVCADALELHQAAQYQIQEERDQEDQEGQEEGAEGHVCKDDAANDTGHIYGQVAEQGGGESGLKSGLAQEEQELTVESFWEDGLAVKVDCEFRKNFLPTSEKDEELVKAMAKVDGMTNPKPDYTYGLRIDRYPIPDDVTVSFYINFLLEVVPILHHPFFIIEGKSDSGSKAEAENQACRGGAALVNAARQLLERIGARTEATGPDQQTFIYSATLSPGLMDFWVHWAEVREKAKPIFHMHWLDSIPLRGDGALGKLRKITHNILDWGCVDRSRQNEEVYDQIFAYERKMEAERKQLAEKTPTKKRKGNDKSAWL